MCRFHCCLAAHQRTRKKDSAEPSFPILWTPPHPPGVIRCGGVFWLPRLTGISDSGIRCRFLIPTSIYRLGALCSGCDRLRFSRVVGLGAFVFHYWGRDCSFLRIRGVLLWSIVGFALTANGSAIWRMKGRGNPVNVVPSPIWYGLLQLYRKLYPAVASNKRRMPCTNDRNRSP